MPGFSRAPRNSEEIPFELGLPTAYVRKGNFRDCAEWMTNSHKVLRRLVLQSEISELKARSPRKPEHLEKRFATYESRRSNQLYQTLKERGWVGRKKFKRALYEQKLDTFTAAQISKEVKSKELFVASMAYRIDELT